MDATPSSAFAAAFAEAIRRAPDTLHFDVLRTLAEAVPGGFDMSGHWRVRLALRLADAEREFAQAMGLTIAAIDPHAAQRAAAAGDLDAYRKFTGG